MSRSRALPIVAGIVLVAGCTPAAPPKSSPAPSAPSASPVAAYFDPPSPGGAWVKAGRRVGSRELTTYAGASHCDLQTVTFLALNWPIGTTGGDYGESRQYVRDPEGVLGERVDGRAGAATPPADALDTGYRLGDLQLWLAGSDPAGVYLRTPTETERWPRADPPVLCR
jgi:hypothetical protein